MQSDWKELIETLNSHNVDFLVVGAHALAFYGRPRFTEDLDIFLRRTEENVRRLSVAMREFGIPLSQQSEANLINNPRHMVLVGNEPSAVDLLNFLDGVEFESAWEGKVRGKLFDQEVFFVSIADFRKTKTASGRAKDKLDLIFLDEITG
jgi:hypothetical protein